MSAYFQKVFGGVDGPEPTQIWGDGGICLNNCSYETDLTDVSPPKNQKDSRDPLERGGISIQIL